MSIKQSLRWENERADRDFYREEARKDETGEYSQCAGGCGNECNPSNVCDNGKKYCDECWQLSDEE